MNHQTPLTQFHYDYVSIHIDQTILVEYLLEEGVLPYDDLTNDEGREVFQWLAFNNFWAADHGRLKAAKIPVLDTDGYGVWVGVTSFGSHYNLYVYPELINALFDLDITYEDIIRL